MKELVRMVATLIGMGRRTHFESCWLASCVCLVLLLSIWYLQSRSVFKTDEDKQTNRSDETTHAPSPASSFALLSNSTSRSVSFNSS